MSQSGLTEVVKRGLTVRQLLDFSPLSGVLLIHGYE